VGDHIEEALSRVQTSMYSVMASRKLLAVTTTYAASMVFYTDGSLIDKFAGFAFHRTGEDWYFYCGAYCLFVALIHIGEVIQLPEKFLILTDSLSSDKALLSIKISHWSLPLVYVYKQMCNDLWS
jgi:uncharacterized protein CbrC (UPF0167 family)